MGCTAGRNDNTTVAEIPFQRFPHVIRAQTKADKLRHDRIRVYLRKLLPSNFGISAIERTDNPAFRIPLVCQMFYPRN